MTKNDIADQESVTVRKPKGGYRAITTVQVCIIWWAYATKQLKGFYDLRVYLALHEIDERRRVAARMRKRKRQPSRRYKYDHDRLVIEIHRLVGGVGGRHIRSALRRLKALGLAVVSETAIEFATEPKHVAGDVSSLEEMIVGLDSRASVRTRIVPIPRTMIRFIAAGTRPAVAAVMFAQAMRCLWRQGEELCSVGSCSAAFISELFGIHLRTAKSARSYLRNEGWLCPVAADRWHINAHGARATINLEWVPSKHERCPDDAAASVTESPPSTSAESTESPPPVSKRYPLTGSKNQQPANRRPSGAPTEQVLESRARLRRLAPADIEEPLRLQSIHDQVRILGWVSGSANDRLNVFAAAQHALRVGTTNPCGLFVNTVRLRRWAYITQADEEAGRRSIRAMDEPDRHAEARMRSATHGPRVEWKQSQRTESSDQSVAQLIETVATMCIMKPEGRGGVGRTECQGSTSLCKP